MSGRGILVLFAAMLLLAACAGGGLAPLPAGAAAPASRHAADAAAGPHLAADAIIADDGARLPLRVWLPAGEVKAAVLAVHGFNDYSNAFSGPAAAWAKQGIATYAYDQRGFGAAPDRGLWVGARRLDEDLATASRLVRARHPGVPLYLLGESMGGAVVMSGVAGAAGAPRPNCDGIILVAPAVWARSTMNVFERVALWTAYRIMPSLTLTGSGLHIMPSDNIPMLRIYSRDPLVIKATRVDAIEGLVDLMDLAFASAQRLDLPTLLLYGEHDQLVPAEAMRRMIEHLPPESTTRRRIAWYPEGYHMLLRDLDGPMVAADVAAWIDNRAAPLPSGADQRVGGLLTASR